MKKLFILSLFAILSIGCKNTAKSTKLGEITNQMYFAEKTIISAHRAGKGLKGYPENCLETMQYLSEKGIKSFEIDIFQTSDNQFLLFHDDKLGRTATGEGVVSNLSSEVLLQSRLIDDFANVTPYKMPFLRDVLKWSKQNNAYLMLDFKKGISYEKIVEMVRNEAMQSQVVLISYSVEQARELHRVAPEMLLSVTIRNEQELQRILDTKIPTNKLLAFTGVKLSEKEHYKRLQELGIPTILGTLGNLDKRAEARGSHLYKEWSAMGIQVFSTDRPLDIEL